MQIKLDLDIDQNVLNNIVPAVIERALTISAILVQNTARDLCKAGNLSNSIQHEAEKKSAIVYSNVEYAPYVEYGTGIYAEGGKGRQDPWVYYDEIKGKFFRTKGMRGQPYMRPALYNNKKRIVEVFRKVLNDDL